MSNRAIKKRIIITVFSLCIVFTQIISCKHDLYDSQEEIIEPTGLPKETFAKMEKVITIISVVIFFKIDHLILVSIIF